MGNDDWQRNLVNENQFFTVFSITENQYSSIGDDVMDISPTQVENGSESIKEFVTWSEQIANGENISASSTDVILYSEETTFCTDF